MITELKEGYETTLGKMFEGGAELSIGQWQKVALARAFLRDAQIIVLDEPTSAMDAKAEYEFFRDFRLLAQRPRHRPRQPPLLDRPHGRLHLRAGRRMYRGKRHTRRR